MLQFAHLSYFLCVQHYTVQIKKKKNLLSSFSQQRPLGILWGSKVMYQMCNCASKPLLRHPQRFLAHVHWTGAVHDQLAEMGTQLHHHPEEACDLELEEADLGGTVTPLAQERSAHLEAPDGGWGWVVLVATILVLALTLAFPSCMGIFYTDLQTEFSASNSETSWVPSIMTAVLHAGGSDTGKQ